LPLTPTKANSCSDWGNTKADGKDVPVIAHVVGGNLILQVQGRLEGPQGKLEIGK
jgi:hypothetical protein